MISVIILDFDGVILESVNVKTDAFRELFSGEKEHVKEIVEFHRQNGGMSRFDKFRYIYKIILQRELSDAQFRFLSERFSELVFDAILKTPFVPGAMEFLDRWSTRIPLYIVSATPEEELIQIIKKRNIPGYFRGIFGSPGKKADQIMQIVQTTHCQTSEVIFIGDAINDLIAAESSGVRFIGRLADNSEDPFTGRKGVEYTIHTLFDLENILLKEMG